ncbi:hypothetical protein ACFVUN_35970 [Kitasatospora griseola]|uniref:hypothetical protein n=1 Tax=Kitasatospora griseola TaxID=2064 RepID=UPI0036DC8797
MTETDATNPPTGDLPAARVSTDGTGWVSVLASPQWWRSAATADNWPELAESIARTGEQGTRGGLCGVIGATTGRPCKVDTRFDPCPHHGMGQESNRCGAKTRNGATCQWNLVVNGACPNHPDTWRRIQQERLARQEAERRVQEEAARARAEERGRQEAQALTVPCSYCRAETGEACRQPNGLTAGGSHAPRHRYRRHLTAAQAASCASCGAGLGELCRTAKDTEASDPHSARRRAATTLPVVPPPRADEAPEPSD